jgi:DNA polymerase-4
VPAPDPWPEDARAILHVDMDAFFAAVELLRHPELRGQPVVVGGEGSRGVVAAASYEARAFGIHSAMPSVQARRRCPHAVFLPGDHAHYSEVSRRVMAVFSSVTPLVEPLSLDEAFLDVGGARRLLGDPVDIAAGIRRAVLDQEQLVCSVGVASTKFLAKLASQDAKPRPAFDGPVAGAGVRAVRPGEELDFLHPLPVERLWGVGPATLARLVRLGVATVGDLARLPLPTVVAAIGSAQGTHLHRLANGIDPRAVEPDRALKSVGHEETFAQDHHTVATLEPELVRMADAVASRLRQGGLAGRTVTLKLRFADFRTITRSSTLREPTAGSQDIAREAKRLLASVDPSVGVRLVGVSLSNLTDDATRQLSFDQLLEGPDGGSTAGGSSPADWDEADRAVDAIRDRFGHRAIGPASGLSPDGLRVKRRGDQQWGPGEVPRDAL